VAMPSEVPSEIAAHDCEARDADLSKFSHRWKLSFGAL
jgi:hypothetical protein